MSWRQLLGVMPRLLYQGVGASLLDLEIICKRGHTRPQRWTPNLLQRATSPRASWPTKGKAAQHAQPGRFIFPSPDADRTYLSHTCTLFHQHDDLVIRAQHAPSTLARQARCSAVLALPFCRAASSTRCAIRASSLGFITWCREPQPPGGLGLGRGRQR